MTRDMGGANCAGSVTLLVSPLADCVAANAFPAAPFKPDGVNRGCEPYGVVSSSGAALVPLPVRT